MFLKALTESKSRRSNYIYSPWKTVRQKSNKYELVRFGTPFGIRAGLQVLKGSAKRWDSSTFLPWCIVQCCKNARQDTVVGIFPFSKSCDWEQGRNMLQFLFLHQTISRTGQTAGTEHPTLTREEKNKLWNIKKKQNTNATVVFV